MCMHTYFPFISGILLSILNAHTQPSTARDTSLTGVSTIDTLPQNDSLLLSLQHYHEQQLQAQLSEFQTSEKGKWLKYIPSLGIGYSLGTDEMGNLKNVLRPSISYNTKAICS